MIELTRRDLRKLVAAKLDNGSIVLGTIDSFDIDNVVVATSTGPITVARRRVAWPGEGDEDSHFAAARALFQQAGLTITEIDEQHWAVSAKGGEPYLFWPASGFWRHPDGKLGGGGARKLIAATA